MAKLTLALDRLALPEGRTNQLRINGLDRLFFATETFDDCTLKLQFHIFNKADHKSGVYIHFGYRREPLSGELASRALTEGAQRTAYLSLARFS